MEIRAGSVEQTDDGRVDVPHLVGAGRAKAHLGLRRVHAAPGPTPGVLPHEAVPRGRRGPDLAEPLGEDRERAGRDVPMLERGDHPLDRQDLGPRPSRRRGTWTGGPIVEHTHALPPAPGMKPTRYRRRNRRSARNGTSSRARSIARRIRRLSRPSGRRAASRRNPDVCSRASTSRSRAVSFRTRRRSVRTSPIGVAAQ